MKKIFILLILSIIIFVFIFNNNENIKPVNNLYEYDKVIALTFDDGPSKYTDRILDILDDNDVVATFFVVGQNVEVHKETIIKMHQKGNEIGNHSYSHKWLTKLNKQNLDNEINKTNEIIESITNKKTTLLRPTYGAINNNLRKYDMEIVMWTVDTSDWKLSNTEEIIERATNVKNGDIILMHDIYETTLESIDSIIKILKKDGYEFVTVSKLNEINKYYE